MNQNYDPQDLYEFEQEPKTDEELEAERAKTLVSNSKALKKTFSSLGFALAITLCITLVTQLIGLTVLAVVAPDVIGKLWVQLTLADVTMYVFGMGAGYLFLKATRIPAVVPEKKKLKFTHWLLVLIVSFGAMYTGNLIGTVFTNIISNILGYEVENSLISIFNDGPSFAVVIVYMVILAPIVEELFFRKLLIDRMLPYGEKVSIFTSALLFGLFHGNFNQFFYATILGLILGFLYCKTGDIKHTIYLHMTINFFGSVVPLVVLDLVDLAALTEALASRNLEYFMENALPVIAYLAYALFIYAVWILGIVLFFLFIKRCTFKKSELLLPEGSQRTRMYYLNAGMMVAFIFCAILMVSSLMP